MTLRTALRTSSNRAAVRLLEEVGIPPTVDYAKQLGVGLVPSVPSLALGTGEVTLEGMTAAYATFASAGVHRTPVVIRRVEDRDGQVIYESARRRRHRWCRRRRRFCCRACSATSSTTARPGRRAAWASCCRPPARPGRPTTTSTPGLSATRRSWWPACGLASTSRRTIIGGGYAGEIAVPLWGRFMKAATRGDRPEWFATPKGLVGVDGVPHLGQAARRRLLRRRSDRATPARSRTARW